jgi:high affinity Mn2+ porin
MTKTKELCQAFLARIALRALVAWLVLQPLNGLRAEELAADSNAPPRAIAANSETNQVQYWNFHAQNTDIVQYHPALHADYSGPNSLAKNEETKETVSVDLMGGVRPWEGAGLYLDALTWQGFGFSQAHGIDGFPNGEAFRVGTTDPNFTLARVFLRQVIGLGGEQETIEDDALQLAGEQDVRRVTITLGKFAVKDIFDNNAYANDPRTQFMNWSLMANGAFDYAADSIGFTHGIAVELNQPQWTVRYGVFQVTKESNLMGHDWHLLKAWQMPAELERRWAVNDHPGAVRLLAYTMRAHMGSFDAALDSPIRPADIVATEKYRSKYGFGLNVEQEVAKDVGVFSRLGWNNDRTEPWEFTDVGYTGSGGISVKGEPWHRPNDTLGAAFVVNGISRVHQEFLEAGGTGILAGDGNLSYGLEKISETYYDFQIWKAIHGALDFQYIEDPAFNRDRGPVEVVGGRLHWEF